MLKSASKVTINTGNVLNLIDIKKKAGQNVTEEVSIFWFLLPGLVSLEFLQIPLTYQLS